MNKKILFVLVILYATLGFAQSKINVTKLEEIQPQSKDFAKESVVKNKLLEATHADAMKSRLPDVDFTQRLGSGGINVTGNVTFAGNNILNRRHTNDLYRRGGFFRWRDRCGNRYRDYEYIPVTTSIDPNTPHPNRSDLYVLTFTNGCGRSFFTRLDQVNNGDVFMDYIDIDDADGIAGSAATFSSSKSTVDLPDCSRIVYAGLYWAGVFPYQSWETENARPGDYRNIKFKMPGQNYLDITSDQVIYDGGAVNQRPYVCYKDVTALVQGLSNPEGEYYAADIRATTGRDDNYGLGGAAGWVMVVIYENQTESSKNINVFDGFATIDGSNSADVRFQDFVTIPSGPVRAQFLTAALEGDGFIPGDSFQIENTSGTYINVNTPNRNPATNFFNGSITRYDNFVTDRTPDSENTLGFDVDLFDVDALNAGNSLITNGQTELDVRFTTSGDVYWPFLNVMAIEIIQPDIQLVKAIDDGTIGNDISGTTVNLGDTLWYDISFQNVGTDDSVNTIITDDLPANVDLDESTLVLPINPDTGTPINYTYTPPTGLTGGRLEFEIPDNLVEEGGAVHSIRFRVQVVSDCSQLRDVCSNIVENQAFAEYDGRTGGVSVDNSPSVSGIDACNFGIIGASNFLVDTSGCSFTSDVPFCGASVDLTAGSGFASYTWRDGSGTVIATGNVPTITVNAVGTYTVERTNPAGVPAACVTATETFNVVNIGAGTNPLIASEDGHVICPADGVTRTSEIYLCGDADVRSLSAGVSAPTVVRWQQLDTSCAPESSVDCPNFTDACWVDVATNANDPTRTFSDEGRYRLLLETPSSGGGICPQTFYFRIFKATVNPTIVEENIICSTPGSITVNNVPAGYVYALVTAGSPAPAAGAYQTSNVFSVTTAGNYQVYFRNNATNCVYGPEDVSISNIDIDVTVGSTPILCAGDTGEINVQINSAIPGPYTYTVLNGTSVVNSHGPTTDRSRDFSITTSGNYTVQVTTSDCSFTSSVIPFTVPSALTITAVNTKDINCTDGIINLSGAGGTPGYNYALWSYTPAATATASAVSYTNVSSIPSSINLDGVAGTADDLLGFTTGTTYNIPSGAEGTYEFIIVDNNNCSSVSSPLTMIVEEPLQFTESHTDVTCTTGGTITITTVDPPGTIGHTLEYSLNGGAFGSSNIFNGLAAGDYDIDIRATKNGFSCSYSVGTITIETISSPSSTASLTQDSTCPQPNGVITFTAATGGVGPYQYGINGVYSSSLIKNNITPGTYVLTVRDSNGCESPVDTIVVDPHPVIPDIPATVDYNCDGTATVTFNPPATPALTYTYSWNGATPQASNVFTNVNPATHTFTVRADRACPRDFLVNVLQNQQFTGSIIGSTNSECNGSDNGTITIQASNFNGGSYEYSIDGGTTWASTSDNPFRIVGVAAGTHDVSIRETSGAIVCLRDLGSVVTTEPDLLNVTGSVTTTANCTAANTASITVQGSGGIPPYEFSIDGGATWQTSNVFSGLGTGTYTVNIRDDNNCTECGCSTDAFVNGSFENVPSSFSTFRIFPETSVEGWDTDADNRIELWRAGYQGVPAADGQYFAELNANLPSALYQEFCTIPGDIINWSLNHRGRSGVDVAQVRIGGSITSSASDFTQNMSDDNTAWGTYRGSYTVPVGQTSTVIAFEAISTATGSLSVGNFIDNVSITVTKVGCVPFEVVVDPPEDVIFTLDPVTCYDGSNESIEVSITSGESPFEIFLNGSTTALTSVSGSASSGTPLTYTINSGLLIGSNNSVRVVDGKGCENTLTALINPQLAASIDLTDANCGVNSGLIEVNVTPGTGTGTGYEYAIVADGVTPASYVTSNSLSVSAGTYDVYVRDSAGCPLVIQDVVINQIPNPTASVVVTEPLCDGNDGSFSLTFGSGEGPYDISVVSSGGGDAIAPQTGVTLGASPLNFPNLSAGTYDITVEDANGCTATAQAVITNPTPIVSTTDPTATDLECSVTGVVQGSITFTEPTGGTGSGTYTYYYRIDGSGAAFTSTTSTTVTGLPAGVYDVRVEDANGCFLDYPDVTIDALPAEPTLSEVVDYNCDGSATVTITAVPGPTTFTHNYTISPAIASGSTNTTGVFTAVPVGDYTITLDYGQNCETTIAVRVEANRELMASSSGTPVSCNGLSDGTIEIVVDNLTSTAAGTFEYSIDGGATWLPIGGSGTSTNPFTVTGLSANTYNVEVRETGNTSCEVSAGTVVITQPDPVVVTGVAELKGVTCSPATGATLDPSATGGNGPAYTYGLFTNPAGTGAPIQTSVPFTDVAAGNYWVVATDVTTLCSSAPFAVVVTAPTPLSVSVSPEPCYNGTNGELDVTITGGEAPYLVSLNGATPVSINTLTYTFTGLGAQNHVVNITDNNGCTATANDDINPQLAASIDLTDANCGVNSGLIEV
ncbi:hypothetical protein, partial [uncultured Tenacibaculum sp.]